MVPLDRSFQYHRFASWAWGRASWTLLRTAGVLRFVCGAVLGLHNKVNAAADACNERARKHVQGLQDWIDKEGI